jgi:uncharacterized iron-regulated membrane protein
LVEAVAVWMVLVALGGVTQWIREMATGNDLLWMTGDGIATGTGTV